MKFNKNYLSLFLLLVIFPIFTYSQKTAEDFYRQGMELLGKHKHEEAIAALTEAIKLNSAYTEAYLERSRLRQNNQRDLKGALSDIETVLQLDPQLGAAYYERSQIRKSLFSELLEAKKKMSFEESLPYKKQELEDLSSAINYGYKNKQSYLMRAFMYWKIFGANQKALEDFTAAISYDPDDYDLYNTRSLVKRDLGGLPGAIADLREVVNIYDRAADDKQYPAEKLKSLKVTTIMILNNLSSFYSGI